MIAQRIIDGERLKPDDDLKFLLTTPLEQLQEGARLIQSHFCGKHIDLCTIINGKSGRCSEDCKYCAQSARHKTVIDEYDFLPTEKILEVALANEAAGVKRYHHNLETSRRYFPHICTTHTFDERIKTIKLAQAADLEVCSGGIIGMGETWQDRIDLAFEVAALGIKSIPINILTAIKGTAFENLPRLKPEDILRTIAIFRYINPTANVRFAAGRKFLPDNGASAFLHGASAAITGNMLTTPNNNVQTDLKLLKELGLTNREGES